MAAMSFDTGTSAGLSPPAPPTLRLNLARSRRIAATIARPILRLHADRSRYPPFSCIPHSTPPSPDLRAFEVKTDRPNLCPAAQIRRPLLPILAARPKSTRRLRPTASSPLRVFAVNGPDPGGDLRLRISASVPTGKVPDDSLHPVPPCRFPAPCVLPSGRSRLPATAKIPRSLSLGTGAFLCLISARSRSDP